MNDLSIDNISKDEYNSVPVFYCKTCGSLNIKSLTDDIDYCDACSSTDIDETDIASWEQIYKEINGEYLIK